MIKGLSATVFENGSSPALHDVIQILDYPQIFIEIILALLLKRKHNNYFD